MYKVLIVDGLAGEGIAKLKQIPNIEIWDRSGIDRNELKTTIGAADILIVRSRTEVDADLLAKAGALKLVIRAGIGLDNVDVEAATNRGIIVMNAPTGNIVTTAEHALALMFAATRHVAQADATLRKGKWEKKKFQGNELRGKTLGLVGLGNIGRTVAERALGLAMKVVAYDPYVNAEKAAQMKIRPLTMDELLAESDYVSIHVPLIPSTQYLFNKDTFAKMKKGAYLINCARGGIVDEAAMMAALDSGQLAGAALDVFETEPLPADHPLLKRDDVVLTPHLGASTDEAQVQVGLEVAEQISQFVSTGALKNAINVPNVSLEQLAVLKPYLNLCERVGSFAAQISPAKTINRLCLQYQGTIPAGDRAILNLALLKGFLGSFLSTSVNFVNVKKILKERGIHVEESYQEDCADYASLVQLTVEGDKKLSVAGTLFGKEEPRIVRIDRFLIDALPDGYLLFTKNIDQPGVVGALGSTLASKGINIARMHLGRDHEKGEAIAVITVDSEPSGETLTALRQVKGMLTAVPISL
jgi:D-3-phosphoglycerate dehydrogenase / 2-oxoglutarate reductase